MRSWSTPSRPVLPAPEPGHAIAVRDSASGEFTTVGEECRGALYVCGITPYDATHLGHAATYLTFDLLVRAWLDAGIPVSYAQNVTDIDDPLLERAAERGEDWRAIAERETELFRSDMTALRVIPPTSYVGAVESIPDVARVVERLLAEGRAYRVGPDADGQGDGDVYADLSTDPRVGRDTADLDPAANLARFLEIGGDPERPGKRDGLDPLLWRVERPGEPSWDGGGSAPADPAGTSSAPSSRAASWVPRSTSRAAVPTCDSRTTPTRRATCVPSPASRGRSARTCTRAWSATRVTR